MVKNPAIKLLNFVGQMVASDVEVHLETEQTIKTSPTISKLKAVGLEWMNI